MKRLARYCYNEAAPVVDFRNEIVRSVSSIIEAVGRKPPKPKHRHHPGPDAEP